MGRKLKDATPVGYEKLKKFIGGAPGGEVKCNQCGYITSVLQFETRCSRCHRPWLEIEGEYFMREVPK